MQKDTIYIDIDDEITTIIEKLQNSPQKIVALVLPKRATVFQSIVNMKLLKRSAENAKKNVVLITSEAGLLPLAGTVGLHVASSLQSKPAIPISRDAPQTEQVIDEDTGEELDDFDKDSAAAVPVGALASAGETTGPSAFKGMQEPETIELDNEDTPATFDGAVPETSAALAGAAASKAAKKGKNKKLKVPNFNRFRMVLLAGLALLILLIGGFVYANVALAKATITLATNSSDVQTKANLTLDPSATTVDPASSTVPAKIVSKQQSGSQQVSTSGQKNTGDKATGTVTMSSQVCGNAAITSGSPNPVPAGTGVSSGGKTFITQSSTTFPDNGSFKNGCVTYQATDDTKVVAQSGGVDYNIAASSFTVAGRSDVTAKSSDPMTGGTDNIVKTVTQSDIDSAKGKLQNADSASIKDDLTQKLEDLGYTAISSSLHADDPSISPSAQVGDQADTLTVTSSTNYTMYGVKQADIKQIVTDNVKKQIDPTKQQILKDGVNQASYKVSSPGSDGPLQVALTATSLAGPDINVDNLKTQLAGKKSGDVTSTLKNIPGVTDVQVKFSPFWVSAVPKHADKVTINIEKAGA